MAATMPLMCNI